MEISKTFDSGDKSLHIGDVFTPVKWAIFAAETFGIYQKWLAGASVFDPTMGEANLLESLVEIGISQGKLIDELPVNQLFGNELNTSYFENALSKFQTNFGFDMSANFTNSDVLILPKKSYDIVFGNPPWQNFVDLPENYKQQIKSYFHTYDLVGNSQKLLLGGSRIDIAALIIQIALKDFLKPGGEAVFFLPLSLFLNDGANQNFRTYRIDNVEFSLEKIYDFHNEIVFANVATRYGLAHLVRDKKTTFPIPYFRYVQEKFREYLAKPLFHNTDPLSIIDLKNLDLFSDFELITLRNESSPRQGVNTCGANDIFFFDSYEIIDEQIVRISNKVQKNVILPKQFVFPLISSAIFKTDSPEPKKWVLLPYNSNGKPIEEQQLADFPSLESYLNFHKNLLQNRKGVLLNATLSRGFWWALLGVGAYCFFPYKIVWEAYGKSDFRPKIFEGNWQANQSLQAFIPLKTKEEAEQILKKLNEPRIELYLRSLKMEGTMNWAQPGKIKKLIRFI